MTFCEEKGWKVGDKFITKGAVSFTDGSIVELYEDDGSDYPLFKLISGDCGGFDCCDGKPGAYEHISTVEKTEDDMNNNRKVGDNPIEETTTNLLLSVLIDNANQCNGHLQSQINRPTFEQSLELCKLIQEYLEDTTDWTGFCEARWCNDGSGDITATSWWGQGEHILGHQDRLIVSWE